ncbi:MAG: TIGR00366 family protein [Bacteroidales bacterium]|nr:TIGR00366 family protein [Bacteroidales bacterium]
MFKKIPHTYAITASLIIISAVLTWIVPAGEYVRQTVTIDGSDRTVIDPASFHYIDAAPQSWQVFGVLLEGFERQAGIIAFLLIIGGAFQILNATHAVEWGIQRFLAACRRAEKVALLRRLGIDNIVMAAVILLFSTFGAVFGMSEETLAFIAIIIPLAISMGYDSLTGLLMVYVAAHVGFSGAVLNPFTVGLAQGLSGLPLFSGSAYRLVCWALLTAVLIVVTLVYAHRVKKTPTLSPMYEADAHWRQTGEEVEGKSEKVRGRIVALLLLLATIVGLVVGVMYYGWYLTEISAAFLAMGIFSGYVCGLKTDDVIREFTNGAKDILGAAIVVGMATGIIIILENGHIIDTILHAMAAGLADGSRIIAVEIMYAIQTAINIIIPSGSAKAALTMPIMAPFSDVIGLSRQATVMAYQFGDGFTNMITPTSGVLMGALALARVPYGVWVKWFSRILLIFIIMGIVLLVPTVTMELAGF